MSDPFFRDPEYEAAAARAARAVDGPSQPPPATAPAAPAHAQAGDVDAASEMGEMLLIATRAVGYGGAAGPLQTVRKIFPAACDPSTPHTLTVIFVPNHALLAAARARPTHALAAAFRDVAQLERSVPLVVCVPLSSGLSGASSSPI